MLRRPFRMLALLTTVVFLPACPLDMMDAFENKRLEGQFRSTNPERGEWTITPTSCLDGKERGFGLADKAGTVYRALEPDCETITGNVTRSNVTINDRHMFRLEGFVEFRCPEDGLGGRADFDGCLPTSL